MSAVQTWIRVEDEFAQFDHPKDKPLPAGVKKVAGYDEHVGRLAREPKRRTSKSGASSAKKPPAVKTDDKKPPAEKDSGSN